MSGRIQVPGSSPNKAADSSPIAKRTLLFGPAKNKHTSTTGAVPVSIKEKFSFNGTNLLSSATTSHVSMKKDLDILQGLFPTISMNLIRAVYLDKTGKDLKMTKKMLTSLVEKRKQKAIQMKLEEDEKKNKEHSKQPQKEDNIRRPIPAVREDQVSIIKKRKIATVKIDEDEEEEEVMIISSPEPEPEPVRSHFRDIQDISPQKNSSKVILEKKQTINQKYSAFKKREDETREDSPEVISTIVVPTIKKRKLVRGSKTTNNQQKLEEEEEIVVLTDDASNQKDDEEEEAIDNDNDAFTSDSEVEGHSDSDETSLNAQVLDFFNNTTDPREIIDLCQVSHKMALSVLSNGPYRSLNHFESQNFSELATTKKRRMKTDGEMMSHKAANMLRGYNAVDSLVEKCSKYSQTIANEINKWGVVVHGVNDELEIVDVPGGGVEGDEDEGLITGGGRKKKSSYIKDKPDLLSSDISLKNYQQVGLNWLYLLYRQNLSCILADEMGLGKTCQVIAFLSLLKQNGTNGPHLIVVPSSTLENWMREFKKFAPSLTVEPYYGSQAERDDQRRALSRRMSKIDVIVTTYNLATSSKDDHSFLKHAGFNVIIYDEGHMLKNSTSDRFIKLMKLRGRFRLLLTGTPLQNNLKELMSLLEFILPDIFVSKKEELSTIFGYRATIASETDSSSSGSSTNHNPLLSERAITKARKMMAPFILRRKKDQVLQHLPPKYTRIEMCRMTPDQTIRYEKEIELGIKHKMEKNKKAGRNTIMYLRKASIHPLLFRNVYDDSILREMSLAIMKEETYANADRELIYEDMTVMTDFELNRLCGQYSGSIGKYQLKDSDILNSGKVLKLKEILDQVVVKDGKKILVFSQFTQVLDILESALSIWGMKFLRLDGSTAVEIRHDIIDKFYEDSNVNVFLLSTKAGGFGINLVCANNVVIFDQSFNPHDDRQAEDRAHRVGQTEPVNVVRLISEDSIDENIYSLTLAKLKLDSTISGETVEQDLEKNLLDGDLKKVIKIDSAELKSHVVEESRDVSLEAQEIIELE